MRLPLLFLHIAGGMVGLLAGTVAMVYRKGSLGHRISGNVFVVAMLTMGACAVWLAYMAHQTTNLFGGLLTVYMITTAWLTARQRDRGTNLFDWGAMIFALAIAASVLTQAVLVTRGVMPRQPGVPLGMYFFTGSIPLLAGAGDLRMLSRGGISGSARIARHLWRMCYGWFIATGSFFLGKQQEFPVVLRKQYLLVPLAVLPLILLVYWLVRVKVSTHRAVWKLTHGNPRPMPEAVTH